MFPQRSELEEHEQSCQHRPEELDEEEEDDDYMEDKEVVEDEVRLNYLNHKFGRLQCHRFELQ